MNRREAIIEIYSLAGAFASEFACTQSEADEIYADAEEAMRTLGATQAELDYEVDSGAST